MSRFLLWSLAVSTLVGGCGDDPDCLPDPAADDSPPSLELIVVYRPPAADRADTLLVTDFDSATYLAASHAYPVKIHYSARDSEGLHQLRLTAATLTTVGTGIESKRIPIAALTSTCPKRELAGNWIARRVETGSSLSIGLAAQNWVGTIRMTEAVTIRME